MGRLAASTDSTGGHKSTGILGDGGPSKFFLNKGLVAVDTGVAGEFGGVPPLEYLRMDRIRNK